MSKQSAGPCPAYWTDEDGRCSDSDAGDGVHHCGVRGTHVACICACGSSHKRPAALMHLDNYAQRIGRASVTVDEAGVGRVMAGLMDLSAHVTRGTVEFGGGRPTTITVELPLASATARGEIELDEETAKALEVIGWSGPNTELLRRRDLQEALNIGGTVLRTWDQLIEHAKAVADGYTQVVLNEDAALHKVAEALGDHAPSEVKWSRVLESIAELVEVARERGTSDE
jgi:hypothetical protein